MALTPNFLKTLNHCFLLISRFVVTARRRCAIKSFCALVSCTLTSLRYWPETVHEFAAPLNDDRNQICDITSRFQLPCNYIATLVPAG